jgi:hypothetical protein
MTSRGNDADASFYYHEDATADVASMRSSAVHGNLADVMKDSIVLFPDTWIMDPTVEIPFPEDEDSV